VATELLPLVEDNTWFFDTELLVLAERAGLRIHEVPVDWIDDPDSRVDVLRTALDDLRGIRRLGWSLVTGRLPLEEVSTRLGVVASSGRVSAQLALFVCVGVLSTLAYALLFLGLRQVWPAQVANLAALLATAVANTALNRRFTFGIRGGNRVRHHVQGLIVFAIGLGLTSTALWLLGSATHGVEVAVLTLANLMVTVMRFLAMRLWMFRRTDHGRGYPAGSPRSPSRRTVDP
jgi:putative flippase GtrA